MNVASTCQPEQTALHTPISVRCFVPPPPKPKTEAAKPTGVDRDQSDWELIFDTETKTDATQQLRFGSYQLRCGGELRDKGFFYSEALSTEEFLVLQKYGSANGFQVRTVEDFIEKIFFGAAYEWRASIIGFNLPFDLSRLAIGHNSARGKTMKGGFSFKLSPKKWRPHIQVKHLSRRMALIQFAKPWTRPDTRRERRKNVKRPTKRGAFIDVKTLAAALLSRSFSLDQLGDFLKIDNRKQVADAHGQHLTSEYVAYAAADVQATWECYQKLLERFETHQLTVTSASKILSEASLGKAFLNQMGVRPHVEVQPGFPSQLTGRILSTYFGGRAEVRLRRQVHQVLYCDFLSMYPTVCTLMGLWKFVIAKGVIWRDSTERVRALLAAITLEDLQSQETWRELATLVKIRPAADLLPLRAKYNGTANTIGLNFLSCDQGLWFTLADLIACKMLSGKIPDVLEAITFEPKPAQEELQTVRIAGNREYEIDPYTDDFFRRLIDLRSGVKAKLKQSTAADREALDSEQLAIKILANATSYGIYVELIVGDLEKKEVRTCFGPEDSPFSVHTSKSEEPGKFFHPLMGTLITGAARLMLACAERLARDAGMAWAFCDTDSIAIAKPKEWSDELFFQEAQSVCRWFEPLNPYEQKGPILKMEDANFGVTSEQLEPLHALCISAKRYALFNIGRDGRPIIRKASAHGLGHLIAPYEEDDAPSSIPPPATDLAAIGVRRWQYDLWYKIVEAYLLGPADRIDLSYHPALKKPAAARYGATSPDLLRWFKIYNQNRPYPDQVKPFGFLAAFQSRITLPQASDLAPRRRGRPRKRHVIRPIAPFDRDPETAARNAFDRETAELIPLAALKTYEEALAWYHLSPESKFINGEAFQSGRTERRHVIASAVSHIGKESNRWEEAMFLGLDESVEYGQSKRRKPGKERTTVSWI